MPAAYSSVLENVYCFRIDVSNNFALYCIKKGVMHDISEG